MLVELTPTTYLALCAIVKDMLTLETDATPLLQQVDQELSGVLAGGMISSELAEEPRYLDALRRGGMLRA